MVALSPVAGLDRRLGDVLVVTEKGKICGYDERRNRHCRRLVVGRLGEEIMAPSVFSRTGWVERKLSRKEVLSVLDLESEWAADVKTIECDSRMPPPNKVAFMIIWAIDRMVSDNNVGGEQTLRPLREEKKIIVSDLRRAGTREKDDWADKYLEHFGQTVAKNDDAAVPIYLWDGFLFNRVWSRKDYRKDIHGRALETLREKFAFPWFCRKLYLSFSRFMRERHGGNWFVVHSEQNEQFRRDLEVGRDALERALNSSWWKWDRGSTCFFWRWPEGVRQEVRDGMPLWVVNKLPKRWDRQKFPTDPDQRQHLKSKVRKVVDLGYLGEGHVLSLTGFFAVSKGSSDIRVVYDATQCGLNDSLWAPNFFIPSVDSLLATMKFDTWSADVDLGDMFLNYFLDRRLRAYAGVDVSKVIGKGKKCLRWERCLMGLKSSPYVACRFFGISMELIKGNRADSKNAFRWSDVKLNLPSQESYDPTMPWVYKQRLDGTPACNAIAYVDDIRPTGSSELDCQHAARQVAAVTNYLGQQDAARKRRPSSRHPGPWAGAMVSGDDQGLWVYISQDKWNRSQDIVATWLNRIEHKENLEFKALERDRGFLVYVSRTYTAMVPFLKGFHLTLESWRSNRDEEGWKIEDECMLDHNVETLETVQEVDTSLQSIQPVPRFVDDLRVLQKMLDGVKPVRRCVRPKKILNLWYGFGDASGSGFGASIYGGEKVEYRCGIWGLDSAGKPSNYRELANLVHTLLEMETEGKLICSEVFLMTDNTVAEAAFYKGTSSNKYLFELVVILRLLEMRAGAKFWLIHVAGTRMIEQGTDGLSRGDLLFSGLIKRDMLHYIPLDKSCLERAPNLVETLMKYWDQGTGLSGVTI